MYGIISLENLTLTRFCYEQDGCICQKSNCVSVFSSLWMDRCRGYMHCFLAQANDSNPLYWMYFLFDLDFCWIQAQMEAYILLISRRYWSKNDSKLHSLAPNKETGCIRRIVDFLHFRIIFFNPYNRVWIINSKPKSKRAVFGRLSCSYERNGQDRSLPSPDRSLCRAGLSPTLPL